MLPILQPSASVLLNPFTNHMTVISISLYRSGWLFIKVAALRESALLESELETGKQREVISDLVEIEIKLNGVTISAKYRV